MTNDPMLNALRSGDYRTFATMAAGLPVRPALHTHLAAHGWMATDDAYDGAPDSPTRNRYGLGATEAEAIADFMERFGDDD